MKSGGSGSMFNPISACIISYNEIDRIAACIGSLSFCDEILVIDSGSDDGTVALAESLGARVLYRKFDGFRSQKQFAVEQAAHDWILALDADEVVSETLRAEILAEQAGGPQPQEFVATCHRLEFQILVMGELLLEAFLTLVEGCHAFLLLSLV